MCKRLLFHVVFLIVAFFSLAASSALARSTIIVLPQSYPGDRAALLRAVIEPAGKLQPGNEILVYQAPGQLLARLHVPNDPKAANRAWAKRQIGAQLTPVLRAIANLPPASGDGNLPGNLMIPASLDEIGRNTLPILADKPADILLIGSWLFFDRRDAHFNMSERYYPSDAHLKAKVSETPFGTAGREHLLQGARVHFCAPLGRSEYATQEHEEKVRRFWSLWTAAQAGVPATFSFDLATCFNRALAGAHDGQPGYKAQVGGKIEMLRARPPMPATLPANMSQPGEYFLRDDVPISKTPPTTTTGIAWVGLKWSANVDVDLYARSDNKQSWLFFGNTRSADGHFNKDFLTATGNQQYEFIEFVRPIDLTKAEVAINLYSGSAPQGVEGKARVWFQGQVYESQFKLTARIGNEGRMPISGSAWIKLDLKQVTGLTSPATATR